MVMQELPTLYEHQAEHVQRLREALVKHRRVILCAPTGCGKTRMAKWILGNTLNREPKDTNSGHALFAVHRRGLVDNASDSFNELPPVPHGLLMAGRETMPGCKLQVASIDTLISWYCTGNGYTWSTTFDLVVFDETHSHISKLRDFLIVHDLKRESLGLTPAFVVGLSATPEAKGLADVFKTIVPGPKIQWLVDNKFLVPFRYFRATQGKLDSLVKKGDEFTSESVSTAMDGLAGDLVRDWKQHAQGRPTVGFFPRLKHAQEAQRMLIEAGVKAEYIDGETPDDERKKMFAKLNNAEIDYLCNVGVVERGTDIPRIGCVQLCTAVGSVVRYKQMVGRGSRPHPMKQDCLILDHGGNIKRHGFFEDEIEWSLDFTTRATKEHEARPTIECPNCNAIYRGGMCRSCGYEPTKKERQQEGLVFDGKELVEIKQHERAEPKSKSNEQIMISALYIAGKRNMTWRQSLGIAYRMAEQQGGRFKVPRTVTVGGRTYNMIPYNHPDKDRRVKVLYPFTVGEFA